MAFLPQINVSSVLGKFGKLEIVLEFVVNAGSQFPQSNVFRESKYWIPAKSVIPKFSTKTFAFKVTAKLVVSIWLPLIADGTLACNHVTKLASGIVTNCAFRFVKQSINANKVNSFFMSVVLIFNKDIFPLFSEYTRISPAWLAVKRVTVQYAINFLSTKETEINCVF